MSWSRLCSVLAALTGLSASSDGRETQLKLAVEACYRQQYDSAWQMLLPLAADTTDPEPAFWQANLVQMLCYETGDKAMLDSFYRLISRAEALCRRRLQTCDKNARGHLYLGMCRLSLANSYAWERRLTRAFRALLGASAPLEAAARLDASLADACFGLGMIEYFRSRGDKYLLGLGILGKKDKAFGLLRRAASGSGPCASTARFSLAWTLGREGEYEKALSYCKDLLRVYPGNRTILRTLRDIRLQKGDYDSVLALGRMLEANITTAFPGNRYYLAENRLVMAKAFRRLAQPDSCLSYVNQVLAWEQYQDRVQWLPVYVAEAKGLKKSLSQ